MYHLTIHTHFAAAHNLLNYDGDCENLHGHNWKVEVEVQASELDELGMAIDFKTVTMEWEEAEATAENALVNQVFDQFRGKR